MRIADVLDNLAERSLTRCVATGVFANLVVGGWSEIEVAALLGALKARGETPEEIAGAAQALREAQIWLRGWQDPQGDHPYSHPYFWSAFVLTGS